ncbi:hypothetical protein FRB99_007477 [Tulasnella sp. 403]|nr:hypothetical protein FRB99_007477 [Tulasnella sp. 403]
MGITRSSRHKRAATGAQRAYYRKKRRFELGRPAAMTKLGPKRIHNVRTRGGSIKRRALRLETGNFAWASEHVMRKTRIVAVVYNASNNELVRTNTLVKSAIVQVDSHPFRQWYEAHYGLPVTQKTVKVVAPTEPESSTQKKKPAKKPAADASKAEDGEKKEKKPNEKRLKTLERRQKTAAIDGLLETQFASGRLYAIISSRPGQSGRADGYILEGQELQFYLRKIKLGKKHQHPA